MIKQEVNCRLFKIGHLETLKSYLLSAMMEDSNISCNTTEIIAATKNKEMDFEKSVTLLQFSIKSGDMYIDSKRMLILDIIKGKWNILYRELLLNKQRKVFIYYLQTV